MTEIHKEYPEVTNKRIQRVVNRYNIDRYIYIVKTSRTAKTLVKYTNLFKIGKSLNHPNI